MIEPSELLMLLRAGHYHYITEAEMRCLAFFALGYATEEIAEAVTESASTVRRHIADVRKPVMARLGLEISPALLRTCIWCHTRDCTAQIPELIEDNQILRDFGRSKS